MVSHPIDNWGSEQALPPLARSEILHSLVPIASGMVNPQFEAFAVCLADALIAASEHCADAKEANASFNAGQLLKNNGYAFYLLATAGIEAALRQAIAAIESDARPELIKNDAAWSLVSYEVMENNLALKRASHAFEQDCSAQLSALNIRIACLIGRESLATGRNPFRPEVLLDALNAAWREFDPYPESHHLIMPHMQPGILFALPPMLQALNDTLIARGVLPELPESYRIKKSDGSLHAPNKGLSGEAAFTQRLKQFFSPPESHPAAGSAPAAAAGGSAAVATPLFAYLADLQHGMGGGADPMPAQALLPQIRDRLPRTATSRVENHTLDLLTTIFDTVFCDQHIPDEIKALIGFLQIPVLKAALIDKGFFFEEAHPARRLIDLLSRTSIAWDRHKGQDDPLYQMMKRNVVRVQQEFDQEVALFAEVVADIESFLKEEDNAATGALAAPIAQALRKEKVRQASKAASTEVAMRVGTGEVVAFVETFLESRWVRVLTLAYSVSDDKPQVLQDAIRTMDDLIWSVKPKITSEQRKELITRLPAILAMLNKWLNAIQWEDADRLRFFADLAQCHASIVRAPLELSPQRQLEIAIDVAQQAAQRRLEKRAAVQAEPEPDEFVRMAALLERGSWLEFTDRKGVSAKVRLAWVSPMRSLYILTTSQKLQSFSVSAEDLAQAFRENRAKVLVLDKLVDRALVQALDRVDAVTEPSVA